MIITIREATQKDYKELMKLYDAFYEGKRNYVSHKEDSFAKLLGSSNACMYVAEQEGKLIGFITASTRFVVRYSKPIMQVEELFVSLAFRKHGIGARLIEQIEEIAAGAGCVSIYIESNIHMKIAHKFYEKVNYKNEGIYFKKILI